MPLLFLLIGMQVVVDQGPNMIPVRKVVNVVLGAIGAGLMLYVAARALGDWRGFWTRENAEDFLVAPVLTLALVPFLCLVAWESKRELQNLSQALASCLRLRGLRRVRPCQSAPGAPVAERDSALRAPPRPHGNSVQRPLRQGTLEQCGFPHGYAGRSLASLKWRRAGGAASSSCGSPVVSRRGSVRQSSRSAATTFGQNWVPALRSISASAAISGRPER